MGKITLSVLPSGKGSFTKHAEVMTNDPARSNFQLTIQFEPFIPKGYRVGSFLFDPGLDIEATLAPGKTYEGTVGIYFDSSSSVEIKTPFSDNPAFTVKLETLQAGRHFNLRVKSSDQLPPGINKLQVKLKTDNPDYEMLEVNFVVTMKAPSATEK